MSKNYFLFREKEAVFLLLVLGEEEEYLFLEVLS